VEVNRAGMGAVNVREVTMWPRESAPSAASTSDSRTANSKIEPNRVVIRCYLLCKQAFQGGNQ